MRSADWDSLCDKIVRPGIEKHLVPLMLYRGTQGFGWMHRRWNFAIQCMESEVTSFTEAIRMSRNPDYAHLCHSIKVVDHDHLGSLFGRLLDNPRITDNVKGLTEYVRMIEGIKYKLTPVSLYAKCYGHPERISPWRIPVLTTRKRAPPKVIAPTQLEFPMMIHRPGGEQEAALLAKVHAVIPVRYPARVRIDLCQDLIADVIAGQVSADNLDPSVLHKIMQAHPLKYHGLPGH